MDDKSQERAVRAAIISCRSVCDLLSGMPSLTPLSLIPSPAACALRRGQDSCVRTLTRQIETRDIRSVRKPFRRMNHDQRTPQNSQSTFGNCQLQAHQNEKHFP
jgi:hypothetical protein